MAFTPEEKLERRRDRRLINAEKLRVQDKAWREKNKERINALERARYAANPEKAHEKYLKTLAKHGDKIRATSKVWRENNTERINTTRRTKYASRKDWHREKRLMLKREVFMHYSGGVIKCTECNVSDIDILTLDHTNDDGAKHRKEVGIRIYAWLKSIGYPAGFQVLCWNHNIKKELMRKRNTIS